MQRWRQILAERWVALTFSGLASAALLAATLPCLPLAIRIHGLGFGWTFLLPLASALIFAGTLLAKRLETSDQFLLIVVSILMGGTAPFLALGCAWATF